MRNGCPKKLSAKCLSTRDFSQRTRKSLLPLDALPAAQVAQQKGERKAAVLHVSYCLRGVDGESEGR